MRHSLLFTFLFSLFTLLAMPAFADGGDKELTGQRKYAVVEVPETDVNTIVKTTEAVNARRADNDSTAKVNDSGKRSLLGSLLLNFAAVAQTRTVASTDAFAQLLISNAQGKRDKWLQAAQQQCHYKCVIKEAEKVEDFYWMPSSQGALDPSYIRFKGFGCRSYIECTGCDKCKTQEGKQQNQDSIHGSNVFYVWCSLRTDSAGIEAMVKHSKFLVQVDTFAFVPAQCELPCDSTGNKAIDFSFANRKDLQFNLSTTFYSSWVNEAIMVTNDQPLGTFTIHVDIDSTQLNSDGVFTYSRFNPNDSNKVKIEGDCFLVPRSYTGTLDGTTYSPSWGTGQYRIEVTLEETCQINQDYYYEPMEVITDPDANANANAQAQAQRSKDRKWDKDKWKKEWNTMQGSKKQGFWSQAAQTVKAEMIGNNWVTTVTSPVLTTISESETEWLERVLGTGDSSSSTAVPGM